MVTPCLPYPPDRGGKIRSYHLLRGLARAHRVDLFTVYEGRPPEPAPVLDELCDRIHAIPLLKPAGAAAHLTRLLGPEPSLAWHFRTSASLAEARRLIRGGGYDLLVADELCMAPYVLGLPGPKLVVRHKVDHRHFAEVAALQSSRLRRALDRLELFKLRRYERHAMRGFDAAVCCCEEDAAALRALTPTPRVAVVGNGVDLGHFLPQEEPADPGPPTLLYVGAMDYVPNVDAVDHFFRRIHPRLVQSVPDVRVTIVGSGPPAEVLAWQRLSGVTVTGAVADVRPHFRRSTATIVPLRVGGGTRLKILESLASGRPVVSTSIGAEGLGLRDGEHLLIADDPGEFARKTTELLQDRALRERLLNAARPFLEAHCSWSRLGERYESLCRQVAETGTL